jgi:DNA modification methylase
MDMKPVIIGDATLYLGDCMDVLPTLGKVDAVITDPPYGIGFDGMRPSTSSHGGRKAYEFMGWDKETPNAEIFAEIFRISNTQVIWGANYFPEHIRPSMGWLFWDKGQRIFQSDGELAYTNMQKALRVFTLNRAAIAQDGAVHPTQKPLALMKWCIDQADNPETILDPFMGSGTTGVAPIQMGRNFIGIEREPKYFDIACKRIEQAAAQGKLFAPAPIKQHQETFL